MGRMISVRVSERTGREVARVARASGRTESAVVREAIEGYIAGGPALRPYEALQDVIGMVEGGPPDLSERTGEKFKGLLLGRRVRRR